MSSINFAFSKAEVVCLASVLLFLRWQLEIGSPKGISNEDYLNKTFFKILERCNKFKTHTSSTINFFDKFYNHLNSKLKEDNKSSYLDEFDIIKDKTVIPGVGVSGIVVIKSTKSDVEKRFGQIHDLINHKNYSFEISYSSFGISFYYKYDDPEKQIFSIRIKEEFEGIIENLRVFSKNSKISVADIVSTYGFKPNYYGALGADYSFMQFDGIAYYVNKQDINKKIDSEIYINEIVVNTQKIN